jgi:hypothetical protein
MVEGPACKSIKAQGLNCKTARRLGVDRYLTWLTRVRSNMDRWIEIRRPGMRAGDWRRHLASGERYAAAQGGGLAGAGSNRARVLVWARGFHHDVERDETNLTKATQTTHQRRRRLTARSGGRRRR